MLNWSWNKRPSNSKQIALQLVARLCDQFQLQRFSLVFFSPHCRSVLSQEICTSSHAFLLIRGGKFLRARFVAEKPTVAVANAWSGCSRSFVSTNHRFLSIVPKPGP